MNLLKADLFHYIKDRTTYVLLAIVFIMPLFTCFMYGMSGGTMTVETVIFQGLGTDILCAVLGLQFSLFFGKDYANNTIRNKLCYGENRYKIAGCFFLESLIITILYAVISIISSLIFGAVFGSFEFSGDFGVKLLCQLAILLSFSMLMTAIVVSTKSMKVGFMVTLMVSVVFTAISYAMPTLAISYPVVRGVCRIFYMIVSSMMVSGTNGIYSVGGQYTFEHLYLNAGLLALVYMALAIGVTAFAVKKQSYK